MQANHTDPHSLSVGGFLLWLGRAANKVRQRGAPDHRLAMDPIRDPLTGLQDKIIDLFRCWQQTVQGHVETPNQCPPISSRRQANVPPDSASAAQNHRSDGFHLEPSLAGAVAATTNPLNLNHQPPTGEDLVHRAAPIAPAKRSCPLATLRLAASGGRSHSNAPFGSTDSRQACLQRLSFRNRPPFPILIVNREPIQLRWRAGESGIQSSVLAAVARSSIGRIRRREQLSRGHDKRTAVFGLSQPVLPGQRYEIQANGASSRLESG